MNIKYGFLLVLFCALIGSAFAENAPPAEVVQLLQKDKWGGSDYATVFKAVQEKNMGLPRLSDPTGSRVFAKLVSLRNIGFCTDKSQNLGERFLGLAPIATNLGKIQMEYVQYILRTEMVLADEMSALNIFALEISGCAGDLVSELYEVVAPTGGFAPNQKNGVRDICNGTEKILQGVEQTIYDRKYMSARHGAEQLDAVARTLPRVARCLAKEFSAQMSQRLNKRAGLFKSDKEMSDLKKILLILNDVENERFQPYLLKQ